MIHIIDSKLQLQVVSDVMGLSPDWHETDNRGLSVTFQPGALTALTEETSPSNHPLVAPAPVPVAFDNAMTPSVDGLEGCVILHKDGEPFAVVNLATLFALATGHVDSL